MMNVCPICGKLTCIHWPEHWVYRRGETYYCSDQCLDVDLVRDMNLIKQVRMERRKKKMYSKTKKDGTPAKKSGPKQKKPEIPEPISGGPWEKIEIQNEIQEDKPERSDFLEVFSLKSRVLRSARYEIVGTDRNAMRLVYEPVKDGELLLKRHSWEELMKEFTTALDQLGVTE